MKTYSMISRIYFVGLLAVALGLPTSGLAQLVGTAGTYGVLGGSTVTNTGSTVITGDLGVSPGTAITGFASIDGGPGLVTGTINPGNAAAAQAHADVTSSYSTLANLNFTSDLSGIDLGGLILTPGVYHFSSWAQLTGTLILDAQGDANARFVFQVGSTLTTSTGSLVKLINVNSSGVDGPDNGIFWQVGSSATIGTGSAFEGNILALASITLNAGASIDDGRALAINGAVTLDNNRINASDINGGFTSNGGSGLTPVPEPAAYGLAGLGALFLVIWRRRVIHARK